MTCTHLVLYVGDLEATRRFYVAMLGCEERRFAPDDGFLSIAVGAFIINFYEIGKLAPDRSLPDAYAAGVSHLGFEVATRAHVETCFRALLSATHPLFGSGRRRLENLQSLRETQTPGPYRFYVHDPDGYPVELHSWEGIDE